MGFINRDKDLTEQREVLRVSTAVVGVSQLIHIGTVPYTGTLQKVVSAAFGLSGSPITGVQIQRFITVTGFTTIPLNGSSLLTQIAFSTSGLLTHTLPSNASTLVQVQSGDEIQLVTSTANTAATYVVSAVVQCLQDFKTAYGLGSGA